MLGGGCEAHDGIRLGSSLRGAHRLLPSLGYRPLAYHFLSTASDGGVLGDSTREPRTGKAAESSRKSH